MSSTWQEVDDLVPEQGWPCQRLRMGWSLVLFCIFELILGKQLPVAIPYMALGLGLACLVSAMYAIRMWRIEAKLLSVRGALDRRPR